MDRRKFVQNGSLLATTPFLPPLTFEISKKKDKPDWLVQLIHFNDDYLRRIRANRQGNPEMDQYGGFYNLYEIINEHSTIAFIKSGICSLLSEESVFSNNEEFRNQLNDAVKWLLKAQNPDGTIDLHTTNFNSPPDTGFFVKWLGPLCKMLQDDKRWSSEDLTKNLETFMLRAGKALTNGGIHTPNHRWVVSAGLAWLNILWPDPKYRARAEQWLAEGIDIDTDGQYHEKSSYIYTPLTNETLIMIARGFDKPELLDHVRRNLEMSMHYVHPNGEVITEVSGRQDRARIGTMERYYFPYRFMAIEDNNPQFAAMCRLIEDTAFDKTFSSALGNILENQSLWKDLPQPELIPSNYERHFKESGLVHIRRGDYDASIIASSPAFFTFHKRKVALQGMRFASAFFGKGQFTSEKLVKEGDTWKLQKELQGPYYQPLTEDLTTGDNDWSKTPRTFRERTEIQELSSSVGIKEIEGGFELEISITGTKRVPVTVELIFRSGGSFEGLDKLDGEADFWMLTEGMGTYTAGKEKITFGQGVSAHKWLRLRGALEGEEAPTAFLTGFTPFKHIIRFL